MPAKYPACHAADARLAAQRVRGGTHCWCSPRGTWGKRPRPRHPARCRPAASPCPLHLPRGRPSSSRRPPARPSPAWPRCPRRCCPCRRPLCRCCCCSRPRRCCLLHRAPAVRAPGWPLVLFAAGPSSPLSLRRKEAGSEDDEGKAQGTRQLLAMQLHHSCCKDNLQRSPVACGMRLAAPAQADGHRPVLRCLGSSCSMEPCAVPAAAAAELLLGPGSGVARCKEGCTKTGLFRRSQAWHGANNKALKGPPLAQPPSPAPGSPLLDGRPPPRSQAHVHTLPHLW